MKEVLVIVDGMSEQARNAFLTEVDRLRELNSKDLATERGSAIDLFEDFNVEERDRRVADGYFQKRWRNHQSQDGAVTNDRHIIRQFLLENLPSLLVTCTSSTDQPVYLFNESYIIKEPHSNVAFRWHTDANEQLCSQTTPEYYSCWVALDDVNEENGTLYFPESTVVSQWQTIHSPDDSSATATLERSDHQREPTHSNETNQEAAVASSPSSSSSSTAAAAAIEMYNTDTDTSTMPGDDDIGKPINVSAGSIVIFSSSQWHRSSVNTTLYPRRVLYVQYSFDIISSTSDGKPLCFAVKCSPNIPNSNPNAESNLHLVVASENTTEPPFLSSKRRKHH